MRRSRAALLPLVCFATGAIGCQEPSRPQQAGQGQRLANAPAAGESAVDRPHVVFSQRSLVIARLGVPTVPPVSVPSRPSPETMRSDDPATVRVHESGTLVGLRPGRTTIRTLHGEGSSLEVEVRAPRTIRVEPQRLDLEPERAGALDIFDADSGERLPPEAAQWVSDAPRRATVIGGRVQAGSEMGPASVSVRFGDAEGRALVLVRGAAGGSLSVNPARARLRAGEVRAFQAFNRSGPVSAEWTSSDRRVAAPLQAGLFHARSAGRANICATALGRRACSSVEVSP